MTNSAVSMKPQYEEIDYIENRMEMDEEIKGLSDYLHILKRRKWQFIVPALLFFLIAAIAALALPSVYRSTATILIEQQEIPQDLVRSTVTSFADQRIQTISQRVMTSVNLAKIIEKFDLYKKERRTESMASLVQAMREDIQLEMVSADVVDPRSGRPMEATIAFTLSYENRSPQTAQKVANEIVSLFLEENLRVRRESAKETTRFLEDEAQKLNDKISDLEAKLAVFKEQNAGALPEYSQLNQQIMDRTEREISNVDQQIRNLEERKIYLRSELSRLNPSGSLYSVDGQRMLGPSDRLKTLQVQYISMATKYAENHPDMVKIKREINALKQELGIGDDALTLRAQLIAQKGTLAELKKRYSPDHPEVKSLQKAVAATEAALAKANSQPATRGPIHETADNPAYVQLKSQLDGADVELRSLKIQRAELKQRVVALENKMMRTPQVEREYRALTRDYDNALAKYQEIKAKQQEAHLAQSLEEERKGERFSLIEPPIFPEEPAKPNRLAILFLGFVFSLGAGVGHVALRESLDDTIHSSKDAVDMLNIPPMAVVPYIQNEVDMRKKKGKVVLLLVGGIVLVTAVAAAVHYFVMPLDVLWYSMLRRAGELGQKLQRG